MKHYNGEKCCGEDLELVQELERGAVEVGDGDVVEVVLDDVQTGRDGHLEHIRRFAPHVIAQSFRQISKASVLLKEKNKK